MLSWLLFNDSSTIIHNLEPLILTNLGWKITLAYAYALKTKVSAESVISHFILIVSALNQTLVDKD